MPENWKVNKTVDDIYKNLCPTCKNGISIIVGYSCNCGTFFIYSCFNRVSLVCKSYEPKR